MVSIEECRLEPSVQDPFFASFAEKGLHALYPGGRGAQLPVPLELVDVLAEDVAGPQSADQVVELSLVTSNPKTNYI